MANEAVLKLEGRSNRRPRQRIGEVVIVALVLLYAGVLLVGPLAQVDILVPATLADQARTLLASDDDADDT